MIYKISVIMSVYNAEKFLQVAINSILNQTYKEFEFIIINDGSTDKSLEIIESYHDPRIKILNQKNQGLSKSLNNGTAIAKGEFIARMDADDISYPDRFEKQIKFITSNDNCVIVGGNANCIDMNGVFLFKTNLAVSDKDIKDKLPESPFFHSATLYRKKTFIVAGKYPEEIFQYFEDKILWNKMSKLGEFHNLPDILIQYRIVPNSISNLPHSRLMEMRSLANSIIKNNYTITATEVQNIKHLANISANKKFANYYLRLGALYLEQRNRSLALKNLLFSFYYQPFERNTTIRLIACFIPHSLYIKLKERNLKR